MVRLILAPEQGCNKSNAYTAVAGGKHISEIPELVLKYLKIPELAEIFLSYAALTSVTAV